MLIIVSASVFETAVVWWHLEKLDDSKTWEEFHVFWMCSVSFIEAHLSKLI